MVYLSPPPYAGRNAPCKYGVKVKFNAPETWPVADESLGMDESKVGPGAGDPVTGLLCLHLSVATHGHASVEVLQARRSQALQTSLASLGGSGSPVVRGVVLKLEKVFASM